MSLFLAGLMMLVISIWAITVLYRGQYWSSAKWEMSTWLGLIAGTCGPIAFGLIMLLELQSAVTIVVPVVLALGAPFFWYYALVAIPKMYASNGRVAT